MFSAKQANIYPDLQDYEVRIPTDMLYIIPKLMSCRYRVTVKKLRHHSSFATRSIPEDLKGDARPSVGFFLA